MSAINVILQSGAVHVLTDGAGYAADGTLTAVVNKAWPVPQLNAVIAARGSAHFAPMIALHAGTAAKSFDDLKFKVVNLAAEISCQFEPGMNLSGFGADFDLVVAGWSETSGPSGYFLCNHEMHGEAIPAWKVIDLNLISLLPQTGDMKAALAVEFPQGVANPDHFDPIRDGIRILEIQRKYPSPHGPGGALLPAVGAYVQLTTITADTIFNKIIHRWPDQIGRQIGDR